MNYSQNFDKIYRLLLNIELLDLGPRTPWDCDEAEIRRQRRLYQEGRSIGVLEKVGSDSSLTSKLTLQEKAESLQQLTEERIVSSIEKGSPHLPVYYQKHFINPLKENIARLITRYPGYLDAPIGAVYDHCNESTKSEKGGVDVDTALHRFLAVISNLHRSFLSGQRRAQVNFPPLITAEMPALATFRTSSRLPVPFVFTEENIKSMFGGSTAVISMPYSYKNHPLLWPVLTHEAGGHIILQSDQNILPELISGVSDLFTRQISSPGNLEKTLLANLWSYWIEEAAADVYGILNMGPAFAFNMAVLIAALTQHFRMQKLTYLSVMPYKGILQENTSQTKKVRHYAKKTSQLRKAIAENTARPTLRAWSGQKNEMEERLDPHPVDLLRLHIHIGAIESLFRLTPDCRNRYVEELKNLSKKCAGNQKYIQIHGYIQTNLDTWAVVRKDELPLEPMQESARQVGAFLANAKLTCFGGNCIQNLETWDNDDEKCAQKICSMLTRGTATSIDNMGDDAQLLAGSTLALFEKPSYYTSINKRLGSALDRSFDRDYYWGRTGLSL